MGFTKVPNDPQPKYSSVWCDRCGAKLEPVLDDKWYALQPRDGLVVQLQTGYGMAYDSLGAVRPVVLCGGCTTALLDDHPYLRAALVEADDR